MKQVGERKEKGREKTAEQCNVFHGRHRRVCFIFFFFSFSSLFSFFRSSFSPLSSPPFLFSFLFLSGHTSVETQISILHQKGLEPTRCRRKRRMFRVFFARRLHSFYPVRGRKGGEIDGGSDESVGSGTKRGCTRCWF